MAVERTHEELQDLLGAYALDATDAQETAAVEAHLETCPWCREEVRQHREVAAVLAGGTEAAPPELWSRIVGSLEGDEVPSLPAPRPLGPAGASGAGDRAAGARSHRARRWLVAAAIVVVVGVVGALLGVVAHQQGQIDDLDQAVRTTTTSVASATRTVSLVDDQHKPVGKVVVAADGSARFVDASGMGPLDPGHVYQLWGVAGGDKISLAVLHDDPTAMSFTVPSQVTTLAVTEERSPGVVTSVQPAVAAGPVT